MLRRLKAIGRWFYRFPVVPETIILLVLTVPSALLWCNRLPYPFRWQAEKILAAGNYLSVAGILFAVFCGIARWIRGEKERGGALLLFAFGAALLTAGNIAAYRLYAYFGPAGDHFADRLRLPENIVLQEPAAPDAPFDFRRADPASFQAKILNFVPAIFPVDDSELTLPALEKLQLSDPENSRLLEYLARHMEWRLYRESIGGNYLAVRRFYGAAGSVVTSSDGSYRFAGNGVFYRYRLALRLSGRSWNNRQLKSGGEHDADAVYHRYVTRLKAGKSFIEVLDENTIPDRVMTIRSISELETEFASLLAGRPQFPQNTITRGTPSLQLAGRHGDYVATIHCNPGGPGDLYLKAYEITGNTPLSADYLHRTATERIGYSADPDELFFGQIPFRIYEGDWGQFYGVRLEVWFAPADKKQPDRKLLEGNFKLEGWMREM